MANLIEMREQRRALDDKIWHLEKAAKRAEHQKLVGKTFRYRNNYSCPEKKSDYWWLYTKVVGVDRYGDLITNSFQTDRYGATSFEPGKRLTVLTQGYQPVSAAQYRRAFDAAIKAVKKLAP